MTLFHTPPFVWRQHKKMRAFLGKKGKVLTFSKLFSAPSGMVAETPYTVALIELADSHERIMVTVADGEDVKIGQEVTLMKRKISKSEEGLILYGVKAIKVPS
ncbi:MAG: OB-fold domain-containing protein [Parcubacteria group bacterium]|nr:OB-fold domain-containing protein [Parcubacteria group bacterium]